MNKRASSCLGIFLFPAFLAAAAAQESAPRAAAGQFGPGPFSGLPWFSGQWMNGDQDRLKEFEQYRGFPSDSATQSMPGTNAWHEVAGCASAEAADAEFRQAPGEFVPSFKGVFAEASWKSHIWGDYPATEARKKLIHLGWMDTIPREVGNGNNKNGRLWFDVKNGAADKYFFLLGRKFAYLDERHGDTAYPMTFDITYEWTLVKHASWPGGVYELDGQTKETFRDFPYGWSRIVRVFKEGYKYQRGKECAYRFCWRPQLIFSIKDAAGGIVRHERMWPNDVADWTIEEDVVVDGVVVLPKGPIGAQASLLAVSWHDSAAQQVKGSSPDAPGNNWDAILKGSPTHWGLGEALDFARAKGVAFCLPEWAARRPSHPPASAHPGDVYRFTLWLIENNLDAIAYENTFDQGSGALKMPWEPAQPPEQDPHLVYRELWTAKKRSMNAPE